MKCIFSGTKNRFDKMSGKDVACSRMVICVPSDVTITYSSSVVHFSCATVTINVHNVLYLMASMHQVWSILECLI